MNVYTPLEVRSVIRVFVVIGKKATEITRMLKEMHSAHRCNESMVRRSTKQFCEGRTLLENEVRSGRPSDSIIDEIITHNSIHGQCYSS